jgi:hypothetical protein
MFLWRWFKRAVFLVAIGLVGFAVSGYVDIHGKPARIYAQEFFASELWKEGVKDMRTWAASVLRVASHKIEEGVTPEDQAKLKSIIEGDLRNHIEGVKKQSASR